MQDALYGDVINRRMNQGPHTSIIPVLDK